MNHDEIERELLKIIDKLLNLLTIQSTSDFVFDEPVPDAEPGTSEYCVDAVAGYAISSIWELEDEIVRDPELPGIGEPEE